MNIQALGALHPYPDVPEWLQSVPIAIPYFDGLALCFILDSLEALDEHEATAAIESFLNLEPEDRLAASPNVYNNYRRIADLADDEDLGCRIDTDSTVWKYVRPTEVFVSRRHRGDRAIYVQVTAECDWEPEHGLQIIFRCGRELSRLGYQDGHLTHSDAYGLPENPDRIE